MRKQRFNFRTMAGMMMLCLAAFVFNACSSSSDDEGGSLSFPDVPEPTVQLSEKEADAFFAELVARSAVALCNPEAPCNDAKRMNQLLDLLANQKQKARTRGIWSQAKAAVDFVKVLKNANTLHRVTVLGAMAKCKITKKADRERIWDDIKKNKENQLPDYVKEYDADTFWNKYSTGKLDDYAKGIFRAVMDESTNSEMTETATSKLAAYMSVNNMRHIDLTLATAGPLLEAGCNLVFAFGDDLVSNAKLAYDFVETNGKFALQAVEGNLTAEALADVCNNNLKLLTKGMESIIPDGQDLFEVMSDLTADQVKALNKEINEAMEMAGKYSLSASDVSFFVSRIERIIKDEWTIDFTDKLFYNEKDSSSVLFETNEGKAYTFYYMDEFENVLVEAKCAISRKTLAFRLNYLESNDLIPSKYTEGDMVIVPYHALATGDFTETLFFWYGNDNNKEGKLKIFTLPSDSAFIDLSATSIEADAEGGTYTVTIKDTNWKLLSVKTEDKFIEAEINDNKINITVQKNTSTDERSGQVTIEGFAPNNEEMSKVINVKQKGNEVIVSGIEEFRKKLYGIRAGFRTGYYTNADGNNYSGSTRWPTEDWLGKNQTNKYFTYDSIFVNEVDGLYLISAKERYYNNVDAGAERINTVSFYYSPKTSEKENGKLTNVSINIYGFAPDWPDTQYNYSTSDVTYVSERSFDGKRTIIWGAYADNGTIGKTEFHAYQPLSQFENDVEERFYEESDREYCEVTLIFKEETDE